MLNLNLHFYSLFTWAHKCARSFLYLWMIRSKFCVIGGVVFERNFKNALSLYRDGETDEQTNDRHSLVTVKVPLNIPCIDLHYLKAKIR